LTLIQDVARMGRN